MTVRLVHWEGTSVMLLHEETLWRGDMDLVSMSFQVSTTVSCFRKIILCIVGVCSSNSLATWWGARNLIYILAVILLNLLTSSAYSTSPLLFSTSPTSSSTVAVLIAKAGHVWVSGPEEFLLYILSLTLQQFDGTPPQSFCSISKRFVLSGKPLIFPTR